MQETHLIKGWISKYIKNIQNDNKKTTNSIFLNRQGSGEEQDGYMRLRDNKLHWKESISNKTILILV